MSVDLPEEETQGLGRTRTRVLALLQDAGEPITAIESGDRLALHPNSARFHLEALARTGLVIRARQARTTPGRPRVTYVASPAAPPVAARRYRLLSQMLASFVDEHLPDAARAAEHTGWIWSDSVLEPKPRHGPATEEQALDALIDGLEQVGFDSHVVKEQDSLRVEVSHCPFLEVAEGHHDVVCSIHLGLMRGLLERVDAPFGVRDLEPLIEPSRCLAHLSS